MERIHERERKHQNDRRHEPVPSPTHPVLLLQRSAGNAAVVKLMRYGTGEHTQFGGARTVTIHGRKVTEGELIALSGDLYASPQDMHADDPVKFRRLLDLVQRDKRFRDGVAGATKVSDAEWEAATQHMPKGKRYVDLAQDNDTHFAPGGGQGKGNHQKEWWKYYKAAIEKTIEHARRGGKGVPEEALILNGFAGHYLTDAFAAGHLLPKQGIKDVASAKAEDLGVDETFFDWPFPESSFSVAVAEKLLAHPVAGKKLRQYKIRIVEWDDIEVTKLSELIYGLQEREPDLFFGAFALIVHDKLNASIRKGSEFGPVEVTNALGRTWKLAGDGTLGESPETRKIGQEAVAASYEILERAANFPDHVDFQFAFRTVWDFTPRPTQKGLGVIKQVLATYADPARAETQQAVADFLIDSIDVVIARLRERDRLATPAEVRDKIRRAAGVLVAPPRGR